MFVLDGYLKVKRSGQTKEPNSEQKKNTHHSYCVMSSFRRHNFSIRGECLKKLTQLSLKQASATGEAVDDPVPYWKATTDQLSVSYTTDRTKVYTIPLTLNELEILFAVCSSVPETEDQATSLIDNVISHYFTTCTKQQFNDICKNKFKDVHNVRPDGRSVYECLTYNLCTFLIRCYAKYKNLQPRIEAMFLESFTNYQFTTYSLCSLLGLLNAFIKTATDDAPSQLHDVVLRQFWDWNFSDGHFDARFHELITNVLQNENYDDTLMSYFDLNYELSSFMFGERIAALQILILKSKFSFSDDYSFIEHILRLKKCESSNENGTAKFDSFLETIKKHGSFLSDCLKFSLETLDYLQHKSMDLSTFSKVEFAFMNKDCCLQVSSLLLFMTDDVKTDLNIARVVDIILEFMRAYTDDSYLFYEGFLVSIMVFASLLNYYTEQLTTELLNMFPIFISNKFVSNDLVVRISKNFSLGLPPLTEDAVVSSVYDITNLLGENSMAHLASLNQRKAVVDDSINSKFLRNFHEQPTFDGLSLDEPSGNATTKKKTPYQEKFGLKKRANTLTTLQSMNIFKNFAEKNMLDNLSIQSVDGSASVSNGATAQRDDASDETAELFKKMTLDTKDDEKNDKWKFWNNVVTALVHVASLYNDQSINVLTITILTQKFGTVSETLDSIILHKLPILVNQVGETEFQLLLKFIQYHEKNAKTKAGITSCMESRCEISKVLHQLGPKHPLYMIYLKDLLENIVAEGENQASETLSLVDYDGRSVSQKDGLARPELQKLASSYRSTRSRGHQNQHTAKTEHEVMSSGGRIMVYLKPVSLLLPGLNERKINYQKDLDETLVNLFRNSWFNMVIHGFYYPFPQLDRRLVSKSSSAHGSLSTMSGMRDKYLQVFAYNSPPLASNYPKSTRETSFEMNTILRRDTSESNLKLQNSVIHHFYKLENPLISNNSVSNQVKTLFLSSSIMLELYRCDSLSDESVSSCILYLTDPQVKSHFSKFFQNFSLELVKWVSKKAKLTKNAASRVPFDLQKMLICTSSRDVDVQKQSFECCNSFIQHCPDILIRNETSIFTMLGLLSVVFKSCVDMKQTTMSPPFQYTIHTGDTHTETIFLPMNDTWRIQTLQLMEQFYSKWISKSFKYYQDDIEILLQKFISLKTKRGNNAGRVSGHADFYTDEIDYAVSFAMTHATGISTREKPILKTVFPPRAYHPSTGTSVTRFDSAYKFLSKQSWSSSFWSDNMGFFSRDEIVKTRELMVRDGLHLSQDLIEYLNLTSTLLCIGGSDHQDPQDGGLRLIRELFEVSMLELSNSSIDFEQQMDSLSVIKHSVDIWANVMREKTGFKNLFLSEFIHCWSLAFPGGFESCMGSSFPVFSKKFDIVGSEYNEMEYKPSGTEQIQHRDRITMAHFEKMHHVLQFWCQFIKKEYSGSSSSGLDATVHVFLLLIASPKVFATLSTHPFSLKIRLDILEILLICIEKLQGDFTQLTQLCNWLVYDGCLWFSLPNGQGSVYGENEIEMIFCVEQLQKIQTKLAYCFNKIAKFVDPLLGDASSSKNQVIILQKMIALEIKNLRDWMSLDNSGGVMSIELGDSGANNTDITESLVKTSFAMDCGLCLQLLVRFRLGEKFGALVTRLLVTMPHVTDSVLQNGDLILAYLLSSGASKDVSRFLYRNMVFFKPIAPIQSINIFKMLAQGGSTKSLNNVILQFNLKSLEYHDSRVVFFYIPQIVQCLRYDPLGYVEKFIIDTGKVNMYFQHQIIWNMLANMYKDDEGVVPDEVLKPLLDKLYNKILNNFTVREREFYDLEFGFFNEVTAISGKLKPFIKKSKMEKKLKIDQEMALIEIKPRVYLPSHPDGTVVDIDRLSGKPLQSHAKAPFMATFLIRGVASTEKSTTETSTTEKSTTETNEGTCTEITSSTRAPSSNTRWQSAIFKVGDDCRQDVLAIQLINVCKNIWEHYCLDIYVFPYRVIATNAGCGLIDVLPHSISRDMLGREAVNGLYEWFVNKFGDENSMDFEIARLNFIKSLAGYSVISYLLQFKDRHNGNIMYDDMGHILHIDFGFIFDIVPGGVKFEAVPFKLTKEMVKILGGSKNSKYFLLFEKLCCQAFLQLRWQHEFIIKCIEPMLDSGLPCFKANKTIKNLKNRFVLGKDDLQAAQYMKHLINKSYESVYTKGYDEFQKLTNGIPY